MDGQEAESGCPNKGRNPLPSFQMWAWFLTQKLSEGETDSLGGRTLEYHGNDSSSPS